jgi:polysaccharide pyruvyl transferase WcaK-like protein
MSEMLTLFHIGPKGFNIGNDAIREGMTALIAETFGHLVNLVSIPATARFETHQRAGLTAGVIHEINQYGDGVIVGGGNLLENGQLTVDTNALEALGVPMMLFSLSWGRIYSRNGELVRRTDAMDDSLISALHRSALMAVARDRATFDHLGEIGVENALLGGCPTLFLDQLANRLPRLSKVDIGRTLVSIRSPHLMNVPLTTQQKTPENITEIVDLLRRRNRNPVLLCHDHRDIPFAASFENVDYIYVQDVFQYLALLESAELVVTYRLHSALPSLVYGTPFVKISYDERSTSLIETIGLGDWNINLMDSQGVSEAVADRLDNLHELDRIVEKTTDIRDGLKDVMRQATFDFRDEVLR